MISQNCFMDYYIEYIKTHIHYKSFNQMIINDNEKNVKTLIL